MKPKRPLKTMHDKNAPPKVRRPPGSPTKSQLQAIAQAEGRAMVAKWKTLIPVAKTTWAKLDVRDLTRVEGRIHILAVLVQLHYQGGRVDADRQVKAFFDKYLPTSTPAPAPIISVPAPIIAEPTAATSTAAD